MERERVPEFGSDDEEVGPEFSNQFLMFERHILFSKREKLVPEFGSDDEEVRGHVGEGRPRQRLGKW